MRPHENDLDEEIRGHLAISIRERIERGEDPEAARIAALREFGYVPAIRDSMRRVWYSRWLDVADVFLQDVRIGLRSLLRARGLAATVVITLALGIGANAAVFSVVRDVLLRPLANRDADRLIYVRQSAPGLRSDNTTFSMAEINDLRARVRTVSAFGDFSTIEFTMAGLGEPRVVQAGVASGSYFEVMGVRPVLGRLLNASDDGPEAAPAAVLTHRFWSKSLAGDPTVVGRTIRLGRRLVRIVGVLEPSLPYPTDTQIIANVVTSSHHLSATMVTERTHRMTELFGRLAPGATLDSARAELTAVHAAMVREHPDAYPATAAMQVSATPFGHQVTAPARAVLLVLLAAAALVFVIACANVANLILARSIRRENELIVRAALGAGRAALRRTLLAESLVLCGAGAVLGILMARPLVTVIGRFAARFSVRAHDVTVDASLLWVGAGLALVAAIVLAYVPRLPSSHALTGSEAASKGLRTTPGTRRRLRVFAVTQIALSFVLLAAAGMLLTALARLQTAHTGFNMRQVLALDVPMPLEVFGPKAIEFVEQVTSRVERLPGVAHVAFGNVVPWRDAGSFSGSSPFAVEGRQLISGEDEPQARFRIVTPGFFAALGVPLLAGRNFAPDDDADREPVVVVSRSVEQRLFPGESALNRRLWWTDPVLGPPHRRRIVGVVADVDDEHLVPQPTMTIYHPLRQMPFGRRLFVHTTGDPYELVSPVTEIVRQLAADQPVANASTLEDVRMQVLAPERLNAFVVAGFGGVALLIAVIGVAGVLAFSVSARTREFGVQLALGSTRRRLLTGVLTEGGLIVLAGIVAGGAGGFAVGRLAAGYFDNVRLPGVLPILVSAALLAIAAILASLMPAARASRVDIMRALRSE